MKITHLLVSVVSLIVIMVNSNLASTIPADTLEDTTMITSGDASIDDKSNIKVISEFIGFLTATFTRFISGKVWRFFRRGNQLYGFKFRQ